MATAEQIASLRLLIAETDDAEPYTDANLNARIDGAIGDLNLVAYAVWEEKAAATAGLPDTSEGGSSRKMGDLYEQALKMAAWFKDKLEEGPPQAGGRTVIRKLRR